MDPYLAKLIGNGTTPNPQDDTERAPVKKYWRGDRTFFLITAPLSAEQHATLIANMDRVRVVQQTQHVQHSKTETA
jgi:hypothetical protein